MQPNFVKQQNTEKLIFKTIVIILISAALLSLRGVLPESVAAVETPQAPVQEMDVAEINRICTLEAVACEGEKAPVAPHINRNNTPRLAGMVKKRASKEVQERVDYAWSISKSRDFIYTLEIENAGTWDTNKLSDIVGANGYRDKGICQFNIGYHPQIVNDKRFQDYRWQIDQCWKHYKGGTRFYGYDVRHRAVNRFEIASN